MVGGRRVLRSLICPMSSPLGGNPKMIPLSECEIWDVWRLLTSAGPFVDVGYWTIRVTVQLLSLQHSLHFQAWPKNILAHQHRKHKIGFIFCFPQSFGPTFFPLWQLADNKNPPPNYPNGPVQGLHRGNAGFLFHEIHHRCVVTRTQDDFGLVAWIVSLKNERISPWKMLGLGLFLLKWSVFKVTWKKNGGDTLKNPW